MSAAEWIAKRREHLTAAAAANRHHVSLPFDQREVNHMAVALEALEAVLTYHRPGGAGCEASDEYAVAWPCPTVSSKRTSLSRKARGLRKNRLNTPST